MNRLLAVEIGTNIFSGQGSSIGQKYPDLPTLVTLIIRDALVVAGVIFLGLLIFGGLSFIMGAGSGDQKKAQAAKSTITSAVIGFLVVFSAFLIIQIVEVITGLDIL